MSDVANWIAARIEAPFMKATTALAIVGEPGSGKSVAANLLCREIGVSRCCTTHRLEPLSFSPAVENFYMILVEEFDNRDASRLKHLMKAHHIDIEPRAANSFTVPFRANFVITADTSFRDGAERHFIIAEPMEVIAAISQLPRR